MGTQCSKCDCNTLFNEAAETEAQVNDRMFKPSRNLAESAANEPPAMTMPSTGRSVAPSWRGITQDKLIRVVRVQNRWRGILIRRAFEQYRTMVKSTQSYFTREEILETVTTEPYKESLPVTEKGPYTYASGAVYKGCWKGGFRWGQGRMEYPDGAVYEGEWKLGKPHGQGGEYTGAWVDGKRCGQGVYKEGDEKTFTGDWQDDKSHGLGKEEWKDGTMYEGSYLYGKKNGKGRYVWSSGNTYDGMWLDDCLHGKGIYTWTDGRIYMGDWKDGKMDGFGIHKLKGDNVYIGYYAKGKKHGYGKFCWSDGREFRGWWYGGVQHGLGMYMATQDAPSYGLWENKLRLPWLTAEQVAGIKQGAYDYTKLFQKSTSKAQVQPGSTFDPPAGFEELALALAAEYKVDLKKLIPLGSLQITPSTGQTQAVISLYK